jgi:ribosomal protein S18 acetylase RimI-like enzyme
MQIRRVRADEGLRVRDFRLRTLEADPDAFAATQAEEAALPASEWETRAQRVDRAETAVALVAELDTAWVGIVFAFLEGADPDTVDIAGLWVDPVVRGHGAGHQLLDAVLEWARERNARQLRVWVTEVNEAAQGLYRACGFEKTGRRQPLHSNPKLTTSELVLPMPAANIGAD